MVMEVCKTARGVPQVALSAMSCRGHAETLTPDLGSVIAPSP